MPAPLPHSDDPETLLTEAYELYADAIFRYCFFRIFRRDRANELMQDTFMKTWEYLCKGEEVENIRAFLYKVASNLIVDEVRKKKEISLDALMEKGFDPGFDGTKVMKNKVDQWKVMEAMQSIDEKYRDVVLMRHVEGFTPAEIAEMLGESANVVSVRLHRGIEQLRQKLHHG